MSAGGCSDGDAAANAAAVRTLASFQDALCKGDRKACSDLLTGESRAAVDELPWQDLASRQPLRVLGSERSGCEFLIRVEDPNDGDRRSDFVVVRENGRFVVDLVATAGRNAVVVEAAGAREEFVPRELTPADYDRIRQHELSQAPR